MLIVFALTRYSFWWLIKLYAIPIHSATAPI